MRTEIRSQLLKSRV